MSDTDGNNVYDALVLPDEALANGGVEILRAGIIDDELYVSARRAFVDPGQWGEVLAEVARRLAILYSLETDFTEDEVVGEIISAFAADLGGPLAVPKKRAKKKTAAKTSKTTAKSKSKTKFKSSRAKPAPARKAAKKKR